MSTFNRRFLSSLFLLSLSPLLISGQSACSPSSTSICVEQVVTNGNNNGYGVYVLDGGVANHSTIVSFTSRPALSLLGGTSYTFQLTNTGNFALHPFTLTTDSQGACGTCEPAPPGVNGANQANTPGAVLKWTPPASSIGTTYYYQCGNHLGLGNSIAIVDPDTYAVDGSISTEVYNNTSSSTGTGQISSTGTGQISSTAQISSTGTINSTGQASLTASSSTGITNGTAAPSSTGESSSTGSPGAPAGTGVNGAVTATGGGWTVGIACLTAAVVAMVAMTAM